jgi:hypothetical protein
MRQFLLLFPLAFTTGRAAFWKIMLYLRYAMPFILVALAGYGIFGAISSSTAPELLKAMAGFLFLMFLLELLDMLIVIFFPRHSQQRLL